MAIIKDVRCERCETPQEALVERDQTSIVLRCRYCRCDQPHRSWCTGGVKLKPYVCTYDGRDWSGDIEHMGIRAEYENGTPVHEADGTRTDKKYRTDFDGRIRAKRERLNSETRRKMGHAPVFVDCKSRVTPAQ